MERKKRSLICGAKIVNEGQVLESDLLIEGDMIVYINSYLEDLPVDEKIDATGMCLIPGIIDDQVHFREPGLTHKAEIKTEAAAAVAGG